MRAGRFEVLLRNVRGEATNKREWSKIELLDSIIAWLKRMNARGHDVYIRPSELCGLVLLTNIDATNYGR
jgi:hypothetical protein